jgi:hypothetical protein
MLVAMAQSDRTPATIILDNGKTLEAYHFGQLDCSSQEYRSKYIIVKGRYENEVTELSDYSDIQKLELLEFDDDPVVTGENETGTIIVYKKNGVAVTLDNATISLSCYGVDEKHNQLKVQMQNPITNKLFEKDIATKNIQYIVF